LFVVLGVAVPVSTLLADPPATSRTLVVAMAMNAKRVRQYEWKQRITVVRRGKLSEPIVDEIRFDSSGQMQRTTISAPEQKQMGGIRGRIAAAVKEDVKNIMQLAGQYNRPQQMADAVKKAQIASVPGRNALRVQASDIIKLSDSMTMFVNSTTHLPTHVDINTSYEGGPMSIAQDYMLTPNGPNMIKSMKVSVPQKNLAVNADSYDYMRQSTSPNR
jgi:hypothetical protein